MINTKNLLKMARKWHQKADLKRKRISFPISSSPKVERGCFVVYTADKRRFAFPICCLSNSIFQELLKMSEEEFGLPSDGPITLPCDSFFLEYLIPLIQRHLDMDIEKALLMSISSSRCSLPCSLQQEQTSQQIPVY